MNFCTNIPSIARCWTCKNKPDDDRPSYSRELVDELEPIVLASIHRPLLIPASFGLARPWPLTGFRPPPICKPAAHRIDDDRVVLLLSLFRPLRVPAHESGLVVLRHVMREVDQITRFRYDRAIAANPQSIRRDHDFEKRFDVEDGMASSRPCRSSMAGGEERFNKPRRARSPSVGDWPSALSSGNARWWATTLRASSSRPPPRSRHFADPVSWQARLLFVGGERDTGINDSEDAGGATPCASRCLASRTEEGLARLLLAVSMGRAALLAERNEDVSHFDPLQSRKYSRTPESRCKLWPSNSFPELESSAVLRLANRQTRPPGLRATACGLCISGVSPERGSGKFQDQAS